MDDRDHFRFIHDLFEFNDIAHAENLFYHLRNPSIAVGQHYELRHRPARKLLVNILTFCLMPNHYHLLLQPLVKNGVPLFMKKLNGGYVQYFNKKHERTGTLFERKYRSVLVDNQAHFIHLPYYIHLNPLDFKMPEWRERELKNYREAINFLNSYRWSSHLDYIGKNNFPSVTQRNFLLDIFEGESGYEKKLTDWLKNTDVKKVRNYTLE